MNRLPLRVRITLVTVGVAAAATVLLLLSGGVTEIEESVAVGVVESSAEALTETDRELAAYGVDLRARLQERDPGLFDDWGDHPGLKRALLDERGSRVAFQPVGAVTFSETLRCRASSTVVACESDHSEESAAALPADSRPRLPDWASDLVVERADADHAVPMVIHGFVATDSAEVSTLIRLETDVFAASETELAGGLGGVVIMVVPFLLLALGVTTWFLLGRVVAPVEAMRVQVDRIGAGSLDQRVPVPPADDELRQLAETMNRMLDRLQQASDSQRQFISDASHELRSPIAATGATLELAIADPDRADWVEVASIVEEENTRLAHLVDDLLLLAEMDERIQSGERASPTTVDLDEICLTEAERPHPTEVAVHVASPARVDGDQAALNRAIRNLVDNATRHATTMVRVEVDLDGPDAVVRVADDGPGVDAEQAEQIFERFFRVDQSRHRTDGGGAGLGLAIARQVVEGHGGTLHLLPSNGSGATFELRLPSIS